MALSHKDINLLTQKATIAGTEKIPVSDTEYVTTNQIASLGGSSVTVDSALSSTSENPVQNKVISAALGDIVINRINLLYGAAKTSGSVYRHSNGTIDPSSSTSIYDDGIPVVAGETLYYKNLYPYFCGIKKSSDDTWVAMSENSVWNASGEYVVPADGLLYVTINNSAPDHQLLTRDESMYDEDIIESYHGINPELLTSITDRLDTLESEVGDIATILASI